jgi:hypothetical protein
MRVILRFDLLVGDVRCVQEGEVAEHELEELGFGHGRFLVFTHERTDAESVLGPYVAAEEDGAGVGTGGEVVGWVDAGAERELSGKCD